MKPSQDLKNDDRLFNHYVPSYEYYDNIRNKYITFKRANNYLIRGSKAQVRVYGIRILILLILAFQLVYLKTSVSFITSTLITSLQIHRSSEKYIRFQCITTRKCGGWGDRLKGMLSTYALSLLLGRKFLIEITQPCDMSTAIRPNQVAWDNLSELENARLESEFKERTYRSFWDSYYDTSFLEYLEKPETIKELQQYDLITIQTAYIFINNLSKNPSLENRIHELGYNASQFKLHHVFYDFYHKLFKLNDRLERKYQEIKSIIKPRPDSKLICAQIRIGGGIDHITFAYPHHVKEFWDNIDRYRDENKINSNYMIYVTSDKEGIEQEAKTHFGQENVFTIANNFINIDIEACDLPDCSSIEDIFLDFHLLQLCDASFVSHSGFGILGAWNRPMPNQDMYVFTNQESLKQNYWDRKNLSFYKVENLDDFLFI